MPAKRKRLITAEDLYRMQLITDARISPDGRHVICSVQRVNRKNEKKHANLWLVPTDLGRPRRFTYGDQNDSSPRWSPDGTQIAFISNRLDEKQPQIFVIPLSGGEARPLTEMKGAFGDIQWSPDGRSILCRFRKKDQDEIERESDETKKELGIVARHITKTSYKYDGSGYKPQERWHLWQINARTGKGDQLTGDDAYEEQSPTWYPDGGHIAFISNRSADPDLEPELEDLFVMDVEEGKATKLATPEGPKYLPSVSPDGRWIAYLGIEGVGSWWRNSGLWLVPTEGSASARNLTESADLHAFSFTSSDTGGGNMMPPTWSEDSNSIFFQVTRHGDTALMKISLVENPPRMERVVDSPGVVGPFTLDKATNKLAYVLNTVEAPSQLYALDLCNGDNRQLTHFNSAWLRHVELGQLEELWVEASDGHRLHGWILTPPGFDPDKQYPSILQIHGGPQVQYGRAFMHEFYYLAAHGYVLTFSNPRGGQGYGEGHCKAIWNQWGTVDYEDIMSWTDYVASLPYIDSERMGVTGGSYGGYMTNLIIGRTNRFRAAVTQRSVSNLISMWGSSDANWQFQRSVANDVPPFEDLAGYWNASPMKYIGNANTPTLVIHSEQDMRVAQEQGEQVYVALKKLGVDTELVLFPQEPHGLSRVGRTDRRVVRLKHILRWFDKYLKDEAQAD